jgi:hypothetical protein
MLIVDASTNPPHLLGVDSNRSRQREISGFFVSAVVIDDPTKILPHRNLDRNAWAAEKGQCNGGGRSGQLAAGASIRKDAKSFSKNAVSQRL